MINSNFVHLHTHNEYSYLDGFGTSEAYVKKAKEMGFKWLALTNHGNIDGLIDFQTTCDKHGIKPVLGAELYVVEDALVKTKGDVRKHLTMLVKNEQGWESLCKLLTFANLEGFYHKPRVDFKTLQEADLEGLIILTGCGTSFLTLDKGFDLFFQLLQKTEMYLEIMPHIIPIQTELNKYVSALLKEKPNLSLVATNDCHYIEVDEWKAQECLLAIQRGAKWDDPKRWRFDFKGLHLRSADEMITNFRRQGTYARHDYLSAIRNTVKIAKKCCEFRIPKHPISLPEVEHTFDPETPSDMHELTLRVHDARRKLTKKEFNFDIEDCNDRIEMELNLIDRKGFARYFLFVDDLCQWCRKEGIMYGPGRGSVGGSLVSYLLNITDINPLEYGLLFSRFINEERIDYPDIDIDFEDSKRDLVRTYLRMKYGVNNVVGVSTFLRMKSKGVLRDVANVFEVPGGVVGKFTKTLREDETISDTIYKTPEGKALVREYPEVVKLALKLENQIRGVGQHAAGVIISGEALTKGNRGHLCLRKGQRVINWSMEEIEYVGLIKFDLLAINALTVLNRISEMVGGIDFKSITLDDKRIFDEISSGNTVGLFQLVGKSTTDVASQIKIRDFLDIAAIISLSRPGPADSGMTDEYIKNRKSKKWRTKGDIYNKITEETYGVIIYQEQVMQVIHEIAGLSYTIADKIRKVIGKKRDAKEFKPYWEMFLEGCLKNQTMDEDEATEFWEMLKFHSGYSFNKSHAVGYGKLGYWTAYCKVNHPVEFVCASLSYGKKENKRALIEEAKRLNLTIYPPKVGISDAEEWKVKEGGLYCPFIEIKRVGDAKARACAQANISDQLQLGFFNQEVQSNLKSGSELDVLLKSIKAYEPESIPSNIGDMFEFDISGEETPEWPLYAVVDRKKFHNPRIVECERCELTIECTKPIVPSYGQFNVLALAEAPGFNEDREGKNLIGKAGDLLWDELAPYGYTRRSFHLDNTCKCFPSKTETPTKEQMKACWPWLKELLDKIDCKLILAMGNCPLYILTGRTSGITRLSGTTEWCRKAQAWVCWCVHPAYALRQGGRGCKEWQAGIKNFIQKLEEAADHGIPF